MKHGRVMEFTLLQTSKEFTFSVALSVEGLKGNPKVRGVNLGGWLVIEGWIKPSLFDGIANGDLFDGTEVQFKSVTLQKYVSAENGGGSNVSVSRDIPSSWETFQTCNQLQELVHVINGQKSQVPGNQHEVVIQQQQLITADLTSIIVCSWQSTSVNEV